MKAGSPALNGQQRDDTGVLCYSPLRPNPATAFQTTPILGNCHTKERDLLSHSQISEGERHNEQQ